MIERQARPSAPSEAYWQALFAQGEIPRPVGRDDTARWPQPARDTTEFSPRPALSGMPAAEREGIWRDLAEWYANGETFSAPVIGCNKGGLLVRVCNTIGFVPASQLAKLPSTLGTPSVRADLESLVGSNLELRLIELDPERNRVICSERAVTWGDEDIDRRLAGLAGRLGDEIEGTVRSVCDFGVFVDLGGIDGLIHISELSWQRVDHPSDVVDVHAPVRVLILSVDHEARRVALSLKRLCPDPWQLVGAKYAVGDSIEAVITNVVDFGAFARVPEGIDGLIHISELADGPFFHPSHVVQEGQVVRVRVLHVDVPGHRLGLSLRQA
jgi:small subunit ribosomal protein S1